MWAPTSSAEVDRALAADTLPETVVFDGKATLPDPRNPKKNLDIATDVAAFANTNGGTLLYGVGEDARGRLTCSTPIPLADAPERIDQIVRTGVAEVPTIEVRSLPLAPGAADGYLAVIIPPSPRMPHMVVVDGEHRYYGRSATGNYKMAEAEVARLYERRARWAVDRDALLRSAVEEATRALWPRAPHLAYLYVLMRPVVPEPSLLDLGTGVRDLQRTEALHKLLERAAAAYPPRANPDLRPDANWYRRGTGWKAGTSQARAQFNPSRPTEADLSEMNRIVDLEIQPDGSALLFYGRAGEGQMPASFRLFEDHVAGLTTRTFAALGGLYATANYYAAVDVGVAVVGLADRPEVESGSCANCLPISFTTDYYATERVTAQELATEPKSVAERLTMPLCQATAQNYDPFR